MNFGFELQSNYRFLGAFEKLQEATGSYILVLCLSVRPSTWNISAPIGHIFVKFHI